MSRKYVFYCDNCEKEFRDKAHLSIKGITSVNISYRDSKDKWAILPVKDGVKEKHFCNCECFSLWLTPKIQSVLQDLPISEVTKSALKIKEIVKENSKWLQQIQS